MPDNINYPVIKAIIKYSNRPSILTIGEVCNRILIFLFLHVYKKQVFKEILNSDSAKASQDTDIPTKVIKDCADIFQIFFF